MKDNFHTHESCSDQRSDVTKSGADPDENDLDKLTRLIFHLSFPENASVNNHTPKDKCTVKYKDLDHAVRLCMKIWERTTLFHGKIGYEIGIQKPSDKTE